jgi:hypothetical protein
MKTYYFSHTDSYNVLNNEIIKEYRTISNSKKTIVKFEDIQSLTHLFSKRSKSIIKAINYLINYPFIQNHYFKYKDAGWSKHSGTSYIFQPKNEVLNVVFSFNLDLNIRLFY